VVRHPFADVDGGEVACRMSFLVVGCPGRAGSCDASKEALEIEHDEGEKAEESGEASRSHVLFDCRYFATDLLEPQYAVRATNF